MNRGMIVANYWLAAIGLIALIYIAIQLTRIADTMTDKGAVSVHVDGGDIDEVDRVRTVSDVEDVDTVHNPVPVKASKGDQ